MSVDLSPIARELDPLVRRLASNHDGERLAAVAAIERKLKKAGADWHDLADRLGKAQVGALVLPSPAAGGSTPSPLSMATILRRRRDLTAWEVEFLRNVVGLLLSGRPLKPKQQACLASMYRKAAGP